MRAITTSLVVISLALMSQLAIAVDISELRDINEQVNLEFQNQPAQAKRHNHSTLAKYHLVRQRYPQARTMITHAQHVTPSGYEIEPLTVVAVEVNSRLWILDFELLNIYTAQDRSDIKPLTSIEMRDGQVWIHEVDTDWSITRSQPADSATEKRLKSAFWSATPG